MQYGSGLLLSQLSAIINVPSEPFQQKAFEASHLNYLKLCLRYTLSQQQCAEERHKSSHTQKDSKDP